jgi:hypothetical protein
MKSDDPHEDVRQDVSAIDGERTPVVQADHEHHRVLGAGLARRLIHVEERSFPKLAASNRRVARTAE